MQTYKKVEKVYHSIREVHREFPPSLLLEDLALEAVSRLNPSSTRNQAKYRVRRHTEDPRTGLIELTKSQGYGNANKTISEVVKKFYTNEGFEVKEQENYGMIVAKGNEQYCITWYDHDSESDIYVGKGSIFKR